MCTEDSIDCKLIVQELTQSKPKHYLMSAVSQCELMVAVRDLSHVFMRTFELQEFIHTELWNLCIKYGQLMV